MAIYCTYCKFVYYCIMYSLSHPMLYTNTHTHIIHAHTNTYVHKCTDSNTFGNIQNKKTLTNTVHNVCTLHIPTGNHHTHVHVYTQTIINQFTPVITTSSQMQNKHRCTHYTYAHHSYARRNTHRIKHLTPYNTQGVHKHIHLQPAMKTHTHAHNIYNNQIYIYAPTSTQHTCAR